MRKKDDKGIAFLRQANGYLAIHGLTQKDAEVYLQEIVHPVVKTKIELGFYYKEQPVHIVPEWPRLMFFTYDLIQEKYGNIPSWWAFFLMPKDPNSFVIFAAKSKKESKAWANFEYKQMMPAVLKSYLFFFTRVVQPKLLVHNYSSDPNVFYFSHGYDKAGMEDQLGFMTRVNF